MSDLAPYIVLMGNVCLFVSLLDNFNEGMSIIGWFLVALGCLAFIGPNINP